MSTADWQQNILGDGDESRIKELLVNSRTIAVVGMKNVTYKASYYVPKYLLDHGYQIIPVNPGLSEIEGLKCYRDLRSIPQSVDIVEVFRRSENVLPHAQEALEIKPKAFWMQSGIVNMEAAELLARAGVLVLMDRCMYVDHMAFLGKM
ncbi:MAG: CoA-binding protein [Acidobacteriota bacterium]